MEDNVVSTDDGVTIDSLWSAHATNFISFNGYLSCAKVILEAFIIWTMWVLLFLGHGLLFFVSNIITTYIFNFGTKMNCAHFIWNKLWFDKNRNSFVLKAFFFFNYTSFLWSKNWSKTFFLFNRSSFIWPNNWRKSSKWLLFLIFN